MISAFIRLPGAKMKKYIWCILVLFSMYTFADNQGYNNPMVGSRQQSSEQLFPLKLTGTPHKTYHSGKEKALNNPMVGSRQQASNQLFGEPAVTGTPGKTYNVNNTKVYNRPEVGGRQQSSEFIFGLPSDKTSG